MADRPTLSTIPRFAAKNADAFSEASIRWRYFMSRPRTRTIGGKRVDVPPNGLAPAFRRIGGRVYVDEDVFFRLVDELNAQGAA